ncbi:MAG: trypsin-like peptidase domain-containing protein [Candidatus Competibacteraceae bacterium]|nr:trypsin-like peptidase domain-containing protein [Candidatus Competibacteraceae bacterium]
MKNLFLSVLYVLSIGLFGQAKKEFFDERWRPCDSLSASYYRLISYDDKGIPVGVVRDYFVSGELQWEGRFSYIDKGGANSRKEGLCTWYYKNGNKSAQGNFNSNKQHGTYKTWYENGGLESETRYKNGQLHGLTVAWYENGELINYAVYNEGMLVGNESVFCDEFGVCTRVFSQQFASKKISKKNPNTKKERYSDFAIDWHSYLTYDMAEATDVSNWPLTKDKNATSSMEPEGYLLKTKNQEGIRVVQHPINTSGNFDVDISFITRKTSPNATHGLVWAFVDDENYEFIRLADNGYYKIGSMQKGIEQVYKTGVAALYDDQESSHYIGLTRRNDSIEYYIGFSKVHHKPAPGNAGGQIGFVADARSEVYFISFSTVEETDAPFLSPNYTSRRRKNVWRSTGSGFFVSTEGYIVTNQHVVDKANEVEVELIRDGNTMTYVCEVFLQDKANDLAILRISDSAYVPLPAIPYSLKTDLADVGTAVYALGYPLAFSSLGTELKFTEGTINARTGSEGMISAYQVSTPVQPGNSGGPLFDYQGNILGIINAKLFYADNVAFAIKASYLKALLDLLPALPDYPSSSKLGSWPVTDQLKQIRMYVPLIKVR